MNECKSKRVIHMQTNSSNTRPMAIGWLEVIMVTKDGEELRK
jgi:hypothetical protein